MYLVAIIDWYSRYIVGFELSNTLDRTFKIEALQKAIKLHGRPEIINTDQGSQFTSDDYINLLKNNNIKISIDGKGRSLDNQRIERFFRSYKWEKLYLEDCERGHQLRQSYKTLEFCPNPRPRRKAADLLLQTGKQEDVCPLDVKGQEDLSYARPRHFPTECTNANIMQNQRKENLT